MFPEVWTLPRTERGFSADDRNHDRILSERRADVRRHVVRPFGIVLVSWIAVRGDPLHEALQVALYAGVRILAENERCAGMAQKYIAQTLLDTRCAHPIVEPLGEVYESTPGRFDDPFSCLHACY